eukprot:3295539-Prymnesium_polylepis.1
MLESARICFRPTGTLPWKPGSWPTSPRERARARICFCIAYCCFMNERGSGPAIPAPYSFWPRDHVRNAGPLNQPRILLSASPSLWKTRYCTSSCPVRARNMLTPERAIQSRRASHSGQPYQTSEYECVHTFIQYE